MFTQKINKAWVAGAVAFAALTAKTFWGLQVPDSVMTEMITNAIMSGIAMYTTWRVPNVG